MENVVVRPFLEEDLIKARAIHREAFRSFLGIPDKMMGDSDFITARFRADPAACFIAEERGEPVGSLLIPFWGKVAIIGPITVKTMRWNSHAGSALMERGLALCRERGARQIALYTFAHSPRHVGFFQKFGLRPQYLTAVYSRAPRGDLRPDLKWAAFSTLSAEEQALALEAARALSQEVYEGLDPTAEITQAIAQKTGDGVALWDEGKLVGWAVFHAGPGSEAGSRTHHVKFALVRAGEKARQHTRALFECCEVLAHRGGSTQLTVGVNTANREAYQALREDGFRVYMQGIAMCSPDEPAYHRPGVWVFDDWR